MAGGPLKGKIPSARCAPVDTKQGRGRDRFVYCRHGDIIDELNRIGPAPEEVPAGGTDHYLAAFLHFVGDVLD